QALLSAHDAVAQRDYGPVLPPMPEELPEDEEATRTVCLVKNNQPLPLGRPETSEPAPSPAARGLGGRLVCQEVLKVSPSGRQRLPTWATPPDLLSANEQSWRPAAWTAAPGACAATRRLSDTERRSRRAALLLTRALQQLQSVLADTQKQPEQRGRSSRCPAPDLRDGGLLPEPTSGSLYCPEASVCVSIFTLLTPPPASARLRPSAPGATIKRHELSGEIFIARVIHGGLADRSGLLHAGDRIIEVNGFSVGGMEPEQVIQVVVRASGEGCGPWAGPRSPPLCPPQQARALGSIMFKVVPITERPVHRHMTVGAARRQGSAHLSRPQGRLGAPPAVRAGHGQLQPPAGPHHPVCRRRRGLRERRHPGDRGPERRPLVAGPEAARPRRLRRPGSRPPASCSDLSADWQDDLVAMEDRCVEAEDDGFGGTAEGSSAGFRRSLRLCRRRFYSTSQLAGHAPCPSSCRAPSVPYEEVVRYQRQPQDPHRLVALLGPSGVGVNELRKRLIRSDPGLFQGAVPHTTRPPKGYEEPGRDYHFTSREMFDAMVSQSRFLEYGEYKGNLYGTSVQAVRDVLSSGKICVLDIEPNAIQAVRTPELKAFIVYVKPPPLERLRESRRGAAVATGYYVNRPFRDEDFQEMEAAAQKMESQYWQFFNHVLVNDQLQDARVQLLAAVNQAQDEPQWVPSSWI
ncbi:unnamed protein product, partial [Tetraodon nigroviridis]